MDFRSKYLVAVIHLVRQSKLLLYVHCFYITSRYAVDLTVFECLPKCFMMAFRTTFRCGELTAGMVNFAVLYFITLFNRHINIY